MLHFKNKQLLQICTNPFTFLFFWILILVTPFLNYFRIFFIQNANLLPDNLHFLLKNISTPILFFSFFCIFIIVCLLILLPDLHTFSKKNIILLKLVYSSGFMIFVINLVLISLEKSNYPNFLYSKTGNTIDFIGQLNIAILALLSLISVYIIQKSKYYNFFLKNKKEKKSVIFKLKKLLQTLVAVSFLLLMLNSLNPIIDFKRSYESSQMSYLERFGEEYLIIEELRKKTSKNALIIHPPQSSTWPLIGNQPTIRYFLYPRTLVSGALLDSQEIIYEIKEAYFAEIYQDSEKHWPTYDLKSKTISFDAKTDLEFSTIEMIKEHDGITIFKINF